MSAVPFALSIHKFIDSIGADAGFAAIIGLALMALLYFAQARESASLRDELDDAANRIASVEGRLTQVVRTQVARQDADANVPPAIVPAPAFAGGPRPAAMPAAAGVASRSVPVVAFVGAPAGLGAPALASATRAIPPGAVPPAAPVPTAPLAAPLAAPKAPVSIGAAEAQRAAEDTMFATSPTTAGVAGGDSGATAVAPPPVAPRRVDFLDDEPDGPPPRRTVPPPTRDRDRPRFLGGRIVQAVIAVVVVVVVVVVLLSASGGNPKAPKAPVKHHRHHHHGVVFNPASVNVAVLNGTAVQGLAAEIAAKLATAKYNVPQATISNAATQSQMTTEVGYQPGDQADAKAVAKLLGLPASDVQPADASAIQSCAAAGSSTNAATGAQTTASCSAQVIVTIGQDVAATYGAGTATG
jgi:LytR cell envelope-related transcriptional attenuator